MVTTSLDGMHTVMSAADMVFLATPEEEENVFFGKL